jgi:DNA polymerase-3 subunit beta
MTTTDGHCLAQVSTGSYTLDEPKTWLLPRRAVFELKKILETVADTSIFLGVCGNQVVFSGEAFNFFSKLLVDQFPHYSAILDKSTFSGATIDKTRFTKTLRRAACLLSGQFIATHFSFATNVLKVSMHNKEVGSLEEELPMEGFENNKLDIRFYAPYVLSGLQTFDQTGVGFFLKNNTKPIIFESTTDALAMTFLVMPVSPVQAERM